MQIVHYPHPTLRFESQPIRRVDAELRSIVRNMFELMYEAKGVGLAANQVDLPLRLFIANLAGDPAEGEELVFVNPVISRPKGNEDHEEGCLSIPGVYSQVTRPGQIRVTAFTMQGEQIEAELDGMLARVVQHETDHLDGVLFIDRISPSRKAAVADALADFETEFASFRNEGRIPSDEELAEQRQHWLDKYCK